MKQALIVAFFGVLRDRFTQHGDSISFSEKMRRASAIPGVKGVEIIFPDECSDAAEVAEVIEETGLEIAAVNVNVKGRPEFHRGAISVADPAVRGAARSLMISAKEFAEKIGAKRVTCAPLCDGHDYPMQQAHGVAWQRAVETMRAVAESSPGILLHIEHKPSDPRTRGLLATPEAVLRLIADIDRRGVGMTFNVGHQSLDGLNPAASLTRILETDVPLYLHVCDAAKEWDWDLLPGSHHCWELLEVLQILVGYRYDGWLTSDSFPIRNNAPSFETAHVKTIDRMWRLAEMRPAVREHMDATTSWKEVEEWLFPKQYVDLHLRHS